MARPARYAARETGQTQEELADRDAHRTILTSERKGAAVRNPVEGDREAQGLNRTLERRAPLDDGQDERQSSRRGQVAEGELELSRSVAGRMGWVPLDQWKRDPAKWVDADVFLERTPAEVDRLRDRARRTGAVADAAQDAARLAARTNAEAEVRAAVAAGNEEDAVTAARKVAAASGPDPRTLAWVAANPWFESDPVAKATAMAEARRRAAAGESVDDQLEGSEALIRKLYPQHFPETRRQEREEPEDRQDLNREERQSGEARLSDLRRETREAPDVQGGSRGGASRRGRSKELGWGDIPQDERDAMGRFVARFTRRGMKAEDAQHQLGVEYWKNKGTQV